MGWGDLKRPTTTVVPKKKGKQNESKLQQACVKWFRFAYPELIIFAIPNGGSRNVIEAVRLKNEGVLAGVCDLFIPYPIKQYAGLFIEMKIEGNKPTPMQKVFMEQMTKFGYKCVICYSFDQFRIEIQNYLDK